MTKTLRAELSVILLGETKVYTTDEGDRESNLDFGVCVWCAGVRRERQVLAARKKMPGKRLSKIAVCSPDPRPEMRNAMCNMKDSLISLASGSAIAS